MRVRRIDLAGFGCLSYFSAEFSPGINLVYGLNEAGKSTLQQAISAMLYGFYEADRLKPDEKARHERYRPWPNGSGVGPYRGALQYELEDGRAFEVRRDFSSTDLQTQLIDLALGTDVAPSFGLGRHGNVPFARRQLGMSRGVFQSCAFIAQGEIFQASQGATPREIGDAIAAMADSARRDVSAAAALSKLDGLMTKIGRDRARTAELPRARENLRVAQAELLAADRARASVAEKSAELEGIRMRMERRAREIVVLQATYLVARRRSLSRRVEGVREATAKLEKASLERERLRAYESFSVHLRDRVVTLDDRRRRAAARRQSCAEAADRRRAAISYSERLQYEALRLSVGALSTESIGELEGVAYGVPPLEEKPGYAVRVVRWIRRVVAAAFRRVFRRVREEEADANGAETNTAAPAVTREEALGLLERHRRYLTLRPAMLSLEQAEGTLREESQALASIEAELGSCLEAEPNSDLDTMFTAFLEGCDKRAAFDNATAEAGDAERRREELLGGRSPESMEAQIEECVSRLQTLLAANPEIEPVDSAHPTSELEGRIEAMTQEKHQMELAATRLEEELRAALGDQRGHAEIEEDVEHWKRQSERLEQLRSSAEMAREVIDEAMTAVYRDFAPAVSSFLSDGFEHVSEGRYRRAHVDPATLAVSLLLPETDQVITNPKVSQGTLALAYVLMRIGLAQHMSSVGEPVPLVLDDPFVDMDERRLPLILEFITGLSERMQVLLFTKDSDILRWCEAHLAGGSRRVHVLSRERHPAPTAG